MKGPRWGWYLLIGVVVGAPAGVRLLTWPGSRRQALDPAKVQAGETLFHHEWKPNDPLAGGDGLGPVYNATSCVACHHQGGPGGAGGLEHNVTTFVVTEIRPNKKRSEKREGAVRAHAVIPPNNALTETREGVVHVHAVNCPPDTLKHVHPQLPEISKPTLDMLINPSGGSLSTGFFRLQFSRGVHLSQRNTTALFGAGLIDALPDRVLIANERQQYVKRAALGTGRAIPPVGRATRLADGRIGRFGWKAQSASLSVFVQAACANELGLGNPGQAQPRPLGNPTYEPPSLDQTAEQCDQITAFVASLPRPVERLPKDSLLRDEVSPGKRLFHQVGCAECHTPDVGGIEGLYSDLLLHDMGRTLAGSGSYNDPPPQKPDSSPGESPQPGEWRTPPLWGVADSAPYLHDGRAETLEEAIQLHGGQAAQSVRNFKALGPLEQRSLLAFLKTLRAP
ncbi:MAG TPA: di-heme oxidoredictase family protein [Gemmataceae bacterium]|jgi:CxxC motif-containing protein (DUF1111 family)